MPDTATPITYAERKEQLLIELGARQHALHADIEARRKAIPRLHHERTTAAACQDAGRVQQLGRDIAEHHREIDAATLALRRLGEEVEVLDRHPELFPLQHVESMAIRSVIQGEFAAAREVFQALLTPELQEAARRLVDTTRAMGVGYEPPPLAVALAGQQTTH